MPYGGSKTRWNPFTFKAGVHPTFVNASASFRPGHARDFNSSILIQGRRASRRTNHRFQESTYGMKPKIGTLLPVPCRSWARKLVLWVVVLHRAHRVRSLIANHRGLRLILIPDQFSEARTGVGRRGTAFASGLFRHNCKSLRPNSLIL